MVWLASTLVLVADARLKALPWDCDKVSGVQSPI